MESLTKAELSRAEIERLARAAFGSSAKLVRAEAATEGWYNTGYALELVGGAPARCFLKVAPPPDVPVLTYEHELMRAETAVLETLTAAGVGPVPTVLAKDFSRRIVPRDCLFMTYVEGELLSHARGSMDEADLVAIRRQLGRLAGAANAIIGRCYGYPGQPLLQAVSWRAAFELMIARLLDDARRFDAPLAQPADEIADAFAAAASGLDDVPRPSLTHFDLWDLNVLVRRGPEGWTLNGVIDWERAFWGDPAGDVMCLALQLGAAERAALLQGLAEGRGEPVHVDERRLALYRAYLWLIMIVEAGPRGFAGSIRTPRSSAARRLARDLAVATGERI